MNTPISPKVVAAAIVGILLSAVVSNIGAITPGLFAFLGAWGPFVYGVVITAAMAAAGYLKGDPLRVPVAAPAAPAAAPAPMTLVVKPQTTPDLAASTAASVAAVPEAPVEPTPAEAPTDPTSTDTAEAPAPAGSTPFPTAPTA